MRALQFIQITMVALALSGCATARAKACTAGDAAPGTVVSCEVPGFARRPYDVHLPASYSPTKPVPVLLVIHGGGGNARAAARTGCPGGEIESNDCLHATANREGVALVYPNGTGARLAPNVRTWNAG
ncbi:MAG: hypothetical protein OEX78_12530, partial [Betaproteobacteria bacterium]|nr:hypothetical protein [Betaproteobacteria bacterium]